MMIITYKSGVSPSSGPAGGGVVKDTVISRQAYWADVAGKVHWLTQSQQGDVIGQLWRVIVWMCNYGLDSSTHLVWVRDWHVLALSAQINSPVSVWGSECGRKDSQSVSSENNNCKFKLNSTLFDLYIYFVFLREVNAVGRSEHPFVADEGPSTDEIVIKV